MSDTGPRTREHVKTRERTLVQKPPMYKVLLHNDHYTTMEFVIEILRDVFGKSLTQAVRIMLNVHNSGVGVAGIYPAEIAETKIEKVHAKARDQGFPLRCSMEPE